MNLGKRMRTHRLLLLCTFAAAIIHLAGCRKKTPVQEVSVAQSKVTVSEANASIDASDWSGWRGGSLQGKAPDQGFVTNWSEEENILWRSDIPGRGHSSPTVAGNLVVLATAMKDQQKQCVLGFDRHDGTELWRLTVHQDGFPSSRQVHNKSSNANSTVAFDGENFYIGFLNSETIFVSAISPQGDLLWQKPIGAFGSKFGYAPSPVVYKSLLIVAADNFGGGYIAALDRKTGEIAWRVARGDASSYSSPTLATLDGRDQLLISGGDRVASYNPSSGELIWETQCIAEATCGTVVVENEKVYASGGYPRNETVCLSASGETLWSNNVKVYEPSMVAHGGFLFAVRDEGIAFCWDAETGDQAWKKRLGGNFSSSPIVCEDRVYVANLSGDCFVFEASGEAYTPIATNRLGDDMYATPAFSQGQIFVRVGRGSGDRRTEQLVCIGKPSTDNPDDSDTP